jgi:hypothetical protein
MTDSELLAIVKERLDYDPETGIFKWKVRRGKQLAGWESGSIYKNGYVYLQLSKRRYLAHRIAWLLMTGNSPPNLIDHKNGIPSDNRFSNLRLASPSQSSMNVKGHKNSKSGLKGAHLDKRYGKYISRIGINGKDFHLGTFSTKEDAHAAYCRAAKNLHGEFANYGTSAFTASAQLIQAESLASQESAAAAASLPKSENAPTMSERTFDLSSE